MQPRRDDGPPVDDAPAEGGPRRPGGAGRWWWVLLVAIALVVAVVFARGGDEQPGAVVDTPSLEPIEPGLETGELTIGGEPAAPLLEAGDLTDHAGAEVIGTVMPIGAIVTEGLYWVGRREAGILVVEREGEETAVSDGDVLTFRGTLTELDDHVRGFVWDHQMEEWIEARGVYVDVEELVADPGTGDP